MIKLPITFLLIISVITSKAQYDSIISNNVRFDIACMTKSITKTEEFKAILRIRNESDEEIYIPGRYLATTKDDVGNIAYEILYFPVDSTPIVMNYISLYSDHSEIRPKIKLRPFESYLIETSVRGIEVFKKKGLYKIRFFTQETAFYDALEFMSTKWAEIRVVE